MVMKTLNYIHDFPSNICGVFLRRKTKQDRVIHTSPFRLAERKKKQKQSTAT